MYQIPQSTISKMMVRGIERNLMEMEDPMTRGNAASKEEKGNERGRRLIIVFKEHIIDSNITSTLPFF